MIILFKKSSVVNLLIEAIESLDENDADKIICIIDRKAWFRYRNHVIQWEDDERNKKDAERSAYEQLKQEIESEKFIDEIVHRINSKQL